MIKHGYIAICDECKEPIAYNASKSDLIHEIERDSGFKCKELPLDRDDFITICKDCIPCIIKKYFKDKESTHD